MSDAEKCVFCKSIIPEGIQICNNCEERIENMKENEATNIKRNRDPAIGPIDGVSCIVKGCLTKFTTKEGPSSMKQSFTDCKLMASFETGTVSISMRGSKKIMMTVRLDEMAELLHSAFDAAREVDESNKGEKNDE